MATDTSFLFLQFRPEGPIAHDERAFVSSQVGMAGHCIEDILIMDVPDLDLVKDIDYSRYSGVFLSGSPYSLMDRDRDPDERVRATHRRALEVSHFLLDNNMPTFGICYGLQLLALATGATLTRDYPETLRATTVALTSVGSDDPLTSGLPSEFRSFTGHSEAVADLGTDVVVLGTGEGCPYQLLRFREHLYATQFHPEKSHTAGLQVLKNFVEWKV